MHVHKLLQHYPEAKFVLTEASSAETWFDAITMHVHARNTRFHSTLPVREAKMYQAALGSATSDKAKWTAAYTAHNNMALNYVSHRAILAIDPKEPDSLARLCAFIEDTSATCTAGGRFSLEGNRYEQTFLSNNWPMLRRPLHTAHHKSEHAYVSFVSAGSQDTEYQSLLASINSLKDTRTPNDIVVLVSGELSSNSHRAELLALGVIVIESGLFTILHGDNHYFERLWVFELIKYKKIMFFAPGVTFLANCDYLFHESLVFQGVYTASTPLSADIFIATPDRQYLADLVDFAEVFGKHFVHKQSWLGVKAFADPRTHGATLAEFTFPRAGSDAGLLLYYFLVFRGGNQTSLKSADAWSEYVKFVE